MKTILTFGVYDILHIGHILLFKHAKELLPNEECRLVVAVQDGDYILKYKPDTKMIYTTEERLYMVSTIRYVDEVVKNETRSKLEAWEKSKLEAKKVVNDRKMTPEEREAKIKAIFGLN